LALLIRIIAIPFEFLYCTQWVVLENLMPLSALRSGKHADIFESLDRHINQLDAKYKQVKPVPSTKVALYICG
jgi:hypothetical protein